MLTRPLGLKCLQERSSLLGFQESSVLDQAVEDSDQAQKEEDAHEVHTELVSRSHALENLLSMGHDGSRESREPMLPPETVVLAPRLNAPAPETTRSKTIHLRHTRSHD